MFTLQCQDLQFLNAVHSLKVCFEVSDHDAKPFPHAGTEKYI